MTEIRAARRGDVRGVVDVHMASFAGFFLSSLGPRFLREFYCGLASHSDGVLIVAVERDVVVGFVGGAVEQVGFYRDLLASRKWKFGWAALPIITRRPTIAARVLRARRRAAGVDTPAGACLMTIGVLPKRARAGVGRALVRAFERAVDAAGAERYTLTTDAEDNDGVNRFYAGLGLTCQRVIVTPEGRRLNEYAKDLHPTLEGN